MPRKPRIYDAVYGYVELDKDEFRLVTSAIFQRLHWIKQLGPLHCVFPSAQHSRFSHSIGVFHIVTKMMEHLRGLDEKYKYSFPDLEDKQLRFAALLHDIGHVPLSHVGEKVLKEVAEKQLREESPPTSTHATVDLLPKDGPKEVVSWWDLFSEEEYHGSSTKVHERLSAEIVLYDEEVDAVLKESWPDPTHRNEAKKRIAQIIVGRNHMDIPTLLLHSELDADRLDYLLRDSFFTGVGYGQIDLDYIISRLVTFPDKDGMRYLCVEHKGLHTVEHYILGRFFLQTQVIFNRKVRFMDLLFEDVMRYMVEDKLHDDDCRLMSLTQFCEHIRKSGGTDKRKHLHRIYSYTDAEVFSKMRRLHETLDERERQGEADDEEAYINDCIKIIMDGQVAEPVFHTCQRIVCLKQDEGCEKRLQKEADDIGKGVATTLGVYDSRVKTNIVTQEVMKHNRRMANGVEGEEESNRDAVRIIYEKPGEGDRTKHAATSNATILRDLSDRALMMFNAYYVRSKGESEREVKEKEKAIRKAFQNFVQKEFMS